MPARSVDGTCGLALASDGSFLAFGDYHGRLRLWKAVPGRERERLVVRCPTGTMSVQPIAVGPEGRSVLARGFKSGEEGRIETELFAWSVRGDMSTATRLPIRQDLLPGPLVDDGQSVVGLITEGARSAPTVRLVTIDLRSGRELTSIALNEAPFHLAAFSADGKLCVGNRGDGLIGVWDVASGRKILDLGHGPGTVDSIAIDPTGTTLAVGRSAVKGRGLIQVHDLETGQVVQTIVGGRSRCAVSLSLGPEGRHLAVVWHSPQYRWPTVRGERLDERLRHELERWGVLSTPEDQPPSGEIIDTLTAQVIDRLDLSLTGPEAILFSPDGSRVMSVVPDGGVGIWDLTY